MSHQLLYTVSSIRDSKALPLWRNYGDRQGEEAHNRAACHSVLPRCRKPATTAWACRESRWGLTPSIQAPRSSRVLNWDIVKPVHVGSSRILTTALGLT